MSLPLAAALVGAEDALRSHGWTGARAFDELVEALRERLGLPADPSPEARAVAAGLPVRSGEDLLGLAYERFFADLFKGRRGQFFTPHAVARLLVARVHIQAGERVLDPTCGSGGLLVHAARDGGQVHGIELDPRLAALAGLGLRIAGHRGQVERADFFTADPDPVDVVVANPPFSVPIRDPAVLERYALGRGQRSVPSDTLFVEAVERWVHPGGRAAIVLPWSILVNPRHAAVRQRLADAWERLGVCQLPEGVFRPFGGAAGRAGLLWLRRRGAGVPAEAVSCRWARVRDPGYDVRSQRYKPTGSTEIDALCCGEGWSELPPGAWVPAAPGRDGRRVGDLATVRAQRGKGASGESMFVADLADADRATGELIPRPVPSADVGARVRIHAHDVLVSRLRPNLGNVARAPEVDGPLVGSPEWVVLEARQHPGWVLHALRSPSFRAALPVTGGQTRPRTSVDAVLDARLPFPGDRVAGEVDRLSAHLFAARRALRAELEALQSAVDAFTAGDLDAAGLHQAVRGLAGGYSGAMAAEET